MPLRIYSNQTDDSSPPLGSLTVGRRRVVGLGSAAGGRGSDSDALRDSPSSRPPVRDSPKSQFPDIDAAISKVCAMFPPGSETSSKFCLGEGCCC